MPQIALLDVNVLVALVDPDHVHHDIAHDWFADEGKDGWATCPATENGFVRVISNPAYHAATIRPTDALDVLRRFRASGRHHFWADVPSLSDARPFDLSKARGHRQITDVYLLGLAKQMKGRLATFDRAIPLGAVIGARPEHLVVLSEASD